MSGAAALIGAALIGGVLSANTGAEATETVQLIAFADPVPGHDVNSPFGFRKLPWEKRSRLHAGVDIAAPKGAPVVATTDGVIAKVGVSPTYGEFVEVAHGAGLTSMYAHLSDTMPGVAPGLPVSEGEKIAMVGSTGRSTGPHLHFEMRKDGQPMDPGRFMGRSFNAEVFPIALAQAGSWARAMLGGKRDS
ncbi:MAG TPA: M23 family metallopeptidase [Caulobacteraceae bacterium]|nr:M23 family metallopeptidase [Caulobacteraceae bacterium]